MSDQFTFTVHAHHLTQTERLTLAATMRFKEMLKGAEDLPLDIYCLTADHPCGYSLARFGLVEKEWVRVVPSLDPRPGFAWMITDFGIKVFEELKASDQYACCAYALKSDCVCMYSTICCDHGRKCHGTHD